MPYPMGGSYPNEALFPCQSHTHKNKLRGTNTAAYLAGVSANVSTDIVPNQFPKVLIEILFSFLPL